MKLVQKSADLAGAVLHGLGRRVDRLGTYAFLDARQWELGQVPPLSFEAILLARSTAVRDFTFVQVGAHEGDAGDPLRDRIRAGGWRGVLVEPQPETFAKLRRNYGDQPGLAFEQAVVGSADGTVTFYRVDPAFWLRHGLRPGSESEISSLKREQIRFHVELFGGARLAEREDEYLVSDEVPSLTLPTLLRKHGLSGIDLLQIDAEGFDYEILRTVDWSDPPALVHFETIHLPVADRQAAWALLRANGYRLFATDSFNTLGILERG